MAAGADRRVDEEAAALRREQRDDLVEKNRCVRPRFNRVYFSLSVSSLRAGASTARRSPRAPNSSVDRRFASAPRSETTR